MILYEMKREQDYPVSLRYQLATEFLDKIRYGKRIRLGFVEGDALGRKDMVRLIRRYYDRINYLTVFTKEPEAYGELCDDAWEQYGLAVTVTSGEKELAFCDYVLDCTRVSFFQNVQDVGQVSFYSVYLDRDKIKYFRKMGDKVTVDSCVACLDRAFHNKV